MYFFSLVLLLVTNINQIAYYFKSFSFFLYILALHSDKYIFRILCDIDCNLKKVTWTKLGIYHIKLNYSIQCETE